MLSNFNFLSHGGEMGALMRAMDWNATPLGDPERWPPLLKSTIRLILTSSHPMFLWWGPDLVQFYNDACRLTMGAERHPSALGAPGRECWDEIWPIIGPQIAFVMDGKGSTWNEDQLVPVTRHGKRQDVWWTYGYSPIEDSAGVQGVLVVCNDVTLQHRAKAELEQMNGALVEQIRQRELAQQHEVIQTEKRTEAERMLHAQREAEGERLRALFEQAHGFMCLLRGPDHVFEFANAAYARLVGKRVLIGKTVREALPDIDGQGFFELLDHVYRTGEPYRAVDLQLNLQRSPGAPVSQAFLDFVYQPMIQDGAVTGIFVQGFDATERTLARQALQRSEVRLKEGMKAAGMVVWDWDLLTDQVVFLTTRRSCSAPIGGRWRPSRTRWSRRTWSAWKRRAWPRSNARVPMAT